MVEEPKGEEYIYIYIYFYVLPSYYPFALQGFTGWQDLQTNKQTICRACYVMQGRDEELQEMIDEADQDAVGITPVWLDFIRSRVVDANRDAGGEVNEEELLSIMKANLHLSVLRITLTRD